MVTMNSYYNIKLAKSSLGDSNIDTSIQRITTGITIPNDQRLDESFFEIKSQRANSRRFTRRIESYETS
jgi:hypothetical protein